MQRVFIALCWRQNRLFPTVWCLASCLKPTESPPSTDCHTNSSCDQSTALYESPITLHMPRVAVISIRNTRRNNVARNFDVFTVRPVSEASSARFWLCTKVYDSGSKSSSDGKQSALWSAFMAVEHPSVQCTDERIFSSQNNTVVSHFCQRFHIFKSLQYSLGRGQDENGTLNCQTFLCQTKFRATFLLRSLKSPWDLANFLCTKNQLCSVRLAILQERSYVLLATKMANFVA